MTESLDALRNVAIAIVRELVTFIHHGLLAQIPEFTTVASHPQTLAQCWAYLNHAYPDADLDATASTMQVVERARESANQRARGPASQGNQRSRNANIDQQVSALCITSPNHGFLQQIVSTHPPMEKRIQRLRS